MSGRRALRFAGLDEMMAEVDRLLPGYGKLGDWTLGQISRHLVDALTYSVDGPSARAPWPIRLFLGPVLRRKILGRGEFPPGMKLPKEFRPGPGLDDRAEAEALRAAVRLYAAHAGPMAPHPVLGGLTRDEWTKLHRLHAAHHLGFLLPEA